MNSLIQVDSSVAYDTTLSTPTCFVPLDTSAKEPKEISFRLFQNHKEIVAAKSKTDTAELGWLTGGTYNLQIGNPNKYPCFNLYNLHIPSGTRCFLHILKSPAHEK